jgi:hypothetical protein
VDEEIDLRDFERRITQLAILLSKSAAGFPVDRTPTFPTNNERMVWCRNEGIPSLLYGSHREHTVASRHGSLLRFPRLSVISLSWVYYSDSFRISLIRFMTSGGCETVFSILFCSSAPLR